MGQNILLPYCKHKHTVHTHTHICDLRHVETLSCLVSRSLGGRLDPFFPIRSSAETIRCLTALFLFQTEKASAPRALTCHVEHTPTFPAACSIAPEALPTSRALTIKIHQVSSPHRAWEPDTEKKTQRERQREKRESWFLFTFLHTEIKWLLFAHLHPSKTDVDTVFGLGIHHFVWRYFMWR